MLTYTSNVEWSRLAALKSPGAGNLLIREGITFQITLKNDGTCRYNVVEVMMLPN